jgi:PilZ domain
MSLPWQALLSLVNGQGTCACLAGPARGRCLFGECSRRCRGGIALLLQSSLRIHEGRVVAANWEMDAMPPPRATLREQPCSERYARVRVAQYLSPETEPQAHPHLDDFWVFLRIRDLSPEGVGLVQRGPFRPRALVTVELLNLSRSFTCTRTAEVVHLTETPRGWVMGCAFTDQLHSDELRALLA